MNRDDVMRAARGCVGHRSRRQPARLPQLGRAGAADAGQHHRRSHRRAARPSCCRARSTTTGRTPSRCLTEDSPQHPATRKGAIRVEMERRLQAATRAGRARDRSCGPAISSDRGPATTGSRRAWSSRDSRSRRSTCPASRGVGHQWSYLPDVARTMVRAAGAPRHAGAVRRLPHGRPLGCRRHADGGGDPARRGARSGRHAPASRLPVVADAAGVALRRHAARAAARCATCGASRCAWATPACVAVLGTEPHTPLDDAVDATLLGMGSIGTGLQLASSAC